MDEKFKITRSLIYKYEKSPHWIWYDHFGDSSKKVELPALTQKLIEGGVIHEKEYIKDLEISSVDETLAEEEAKQKTHELMQEGVKLVYQGLTSYEENGVLYTGRLDLLEKQDGHSSFGNSSIKSPPMTVA